MDHKTGEIASIYTVLKGESSADRINRLHHLCISYASYSILYAIAIGVELEVMAGQISAKELDFYICDECDFGRATAYRYRALAKSFFGEKIQRMKEMSAEDRLKNIEQSTIRIDSNSLCDLYEGAGIIRRSPSKMGGRREGAGRKPRNIAETIDELDRIASDPDLARTEAQKIRERLAEYTINGMSALADEDLIIYLSSLRDAMHEAERLLRARGERHG